MPSLSSLLSVYSMFPKVRMRPASERLLKGKPFILELDKVVPLLVKILVL